MANVPPLPLGQYGSLDGVLATDAIPFWNVYYGSYNTPNITYNNYSLGTANVSILGPHWDNNFGTSIIDGNYTAVLQAGQWNGVDGTTSIAQTGTIPTDAKSIQLRVNPWRGFALGISFAGQDVPVFILAKRSFNDWTVGADISAYSGATGQLRLTALSYPDARFESFEIDSIVFSNQSIPEPCTIALFATGLLGLVLARLQVRSK
jgi:hypothetical protein